MTIALPPLSIYVHVPWCVRKCPYCDFNSHSTTPDDIPEKSFLERLAMDIRQDAPLAQNRQADSVFFGGGTPSLLTAPAVAQIISILQDEVGLSANAEITLEANPGTIEAERFEGYRKAGVNRLSIGVQSFCDSQLKKLGRIHNAENATSAIQIAKSVGFDNFNIDIMHGLPDQNSQQALSDLSKAIHLNPTHISWYQLTIEQNTEFFRHPPKLPEDDTLWEIQQQGQALLKESGYIQYEVSAYANANKQCRHNLNYWRYGDFLGVGPGAHGKISRLNDTLTITRTRKTRLPKDYLNPDRPMSRLEELVESKDRAFDYFINTLRLREPVSLIHLEHATGLTLSDIEPTLAKAEGFGWLKREGNFLSTTEQGYLYLNEVLSLWLGDS